ncbi:F0F1 ATP synthase subunit B [Frigoribacterium sp. CG_9.8]|uniref:F0F1 ATP synthase subunit B n=1 Tax=Frigoribacterium sp. CG_9.8 TaxID=2787733 RepID=UPI0018C9FA13|nr:F0F1 ATP synthase subunit B [Frigoribacterium sp. CG_9.8]MBG6107654.1 F-type H+-transporting ATPase subunit b [Frigoribacterium sp. CG_9.8]
MIPSDLSVAAESSNPLLPAVPDIIWSSVIFVVLFIFFWRAILPRVQKMLDTRAELIEGGIAKAENAQAEAAVALEKYTEQLAEARAEAAKIRDQARQDGVKILNELKEQASAEAARVTANALVTIEAERQSALVSLRSEVGSLAIDLAAGVIGQSLSDDKNAANLVDQFLAELEKSEQAASSGTTAQPESVN